MFGVYKLRLILHLLNLTLVTAQGLTRRLPASKADGERNTAPTSSPTQHLAKHPGETRNATLPPDTSKIEPGYRESFTDQDAEAIAREQAQVDLIQRQKLIEQNEKLARQKKESLEKRLVQRRQSKALQQAPQVPVFVLGDNEAQGGKALSLRADEAHGITAAGEAVVKAETPAQLKAEGASRLNTQEEARVKAEGALQLKAEEEEQDWKCGVCSRTNGAGKKKCAICGAVKGRKQK